LDIKKLPKPKGSVVMQGKMNRGARVDGLLGRDSLNPKENPAIQGDEILSDLGRNRTSDLFLGSIQMMGPKKGCPWFDSCLG
jgi:hypothetical protein